MMKYFTLLSVMAFIFIGAIAQDEEGYQFEMMKQVDASSVKDQYRSGTCWCFSTLSFLESELLRLGKETYDLSEMYVVRQSYYDKAIKYVRMHGNLNFAGGGAFTDVINCWKNYGMMPEEAYDGLSYGEEAHVHGELDIVLKNYVDAVLKNKNKKLTPAWIEGFEGILDAYFGKVPEKFNFNGKEYTPKTFAESLEINPDDYIGFSSFTHHPFYKPFILEVPDNWSWDMYYNLPVDEFVAVMDNAVENGYSVAWAADVSEKGFSWKNGLAIVPEKDFAEMSDAEVAKWEKQPKSKKEDDLYSFEKPGKEKVITQEIRQLAFDNYQTTDDHGMHITGIAKDQNGTKYYYVKNSWNVPEDKAYEGHFYASETYVKYKTLDIMVHKDAIPKDLKKKLNID
jgi:bleomycin hydrolase